MDHWVDRPYFTDGIYRTYTGHDSTVAEKINGIEGGLLFAYTGNASMYHCPSDQRYLSPVRSRGKGGYRSYSMSGAMNGYPQVSLDGQTYYYCRRYSDIVNPSEKYVFVEENYTHSPGRPATLPMDRGYSGGVWSMWRGGEIDAWWDPLAVWHGDGAVLGYADGHAEYRKWVDQRTIWFAQDRVDPRLGSSTSECAIQPDNPDQEYMTEHSGYRTQ
jgi:prepilin-type processing-associated H-X9-DG protein